MNRNKKSFASARDKPTVYYDVDTETIWLWNGFKWSKLDLDDKPKPRKKRTPMKIPNPRWFQRLNHWTDRQPLAGLLIVAVLCTTAMVLAFELETATSRQNVGSFIIGLMAGMLLVSVFHVLDVTKAKKGGK